MTTVHEAEQRVLRAARAYRDVGCGSGITEASQLLEAAQALPRTLPPPTVTDDPKEVVLGEVRKYITQTYTVLRWDKGEPDSDDGFRIVWEDGIHWGVLVGIDSITCDELISRPGVVI